MEKQGSPAGGNTGKPEQPIVPHHDQDYRQSEFDQTQTDLEAMRATRASTAKADTSSAQEQIIPTPEGWSRRDFLKIAGLATAGVIVSGGVVGAIKIISDSRSETANPPAFDIGKLDTERQTIVDGVNDHIATQGEIEDFIKAPMPKTKENPRGLEDLTTMTILPSIDMQKAGKVEVWRSPANTAIGNLPLFLNYSIENYGTPLGIFTVKGINTNDVQVFKVRNGLYEKFNLENGELILLRISTDNLAATNIIDEATVVDPAHPKSGINYIYDMIQGTGLKLSLSENPTLFTTKGIPKSDVTVEIMGKYSPLPVEPLIQNGNSSFSIPGNSH